jgi:hydroxymethylglutaryl-CoA lyase
VVGLPGLRSIALVPNERGLTGAIAAGVSEVAVFVAASEEFNRHNVNRSIAGSLEGFRPVADGALAAGLPVRGYVSTVLGCPYQGDVPVADVVRLVAALFELGCHEVSLGDTIGVGAPAQVRSLVWSLAGEVDVGRLAFHGHDTYGMGVANALAAIDAGIATIDTSAGGLGGCPYAGPRAKGNLATEELVYALDRSGLETGVDLDALVATSWWLAEHLGHAPRSSVAQALKPESALVTQPT